MNDLFDINLKVTEALEKYSKTTESMFTYQKKMMSKQYDALMDVIKTINSIDYNAEAKAAKQEKKQPSKPATPATKPKGEVKASIQAAAGKKEASNAPTVKLDILAAVEKKESTVAKKAKAPAAKAEKVATRTKKTAAKSAKKVAAKKDEKAKVEVKVEKKTPAKKAPAKKSAAKATKTVAGKPSSKKAPTKAAGSKDRLEALKKATQHAVKTSKLN